MKKIFTSYTLARSGHHAVIYWVFAHFKNSIYINDPFLAKEPLTNQFKYKSNNMPSAFDMSKYLKSKSNVFTGFTDQSISRSLLINPENIPYEEIRSIIIRDPFNLFASRIAHTNIWTYRKSPHKILPIWKEHAREILGITDTIKTKKMFISYNEWFRSYDYRKKLTEQIDGDKVPGNCVLEYISSWGFGSSFDARNYQGKASQMKVLERWKTQQNNKLYLSLFDEETTYLSREIFGSKFTNNIVHELGLG